MTRKFGALYADDCVREYLVGKPLHQLAIEFGVTLRTIYRWLRSRDVELPTPFRSRRSYRAQQIESAVREYVNGKSMNETARHIGIPTAVISRWLNARGIEIRGNRSRLDDDKIVRLYQNGLSENAAAKQIGFDRAVVRRRLIEAGIEPRNRSTAERLKWSRMTPAEREAQVAAAHEAARRHHTVDERSKRAITNMRIGNYISGYERALAAALTERGITPVLQQAIGPYNCDLGAYPVAVEVFGGNWHWSGPHILQTPERFRYILNEGWHILVVKISKDVPISRRMADHVVAFIEEMRCDPAARRQYRVIRGAGQILAAGSVDDDEISIIPALAGGRDPVTGRYPAIPR